MSVSSSLFSSPLVAEALLPVSKNVTLGECWRRWLECCEVASTVHCLLCLAAVRSIRSSASSSVVSSARVTMVLLGGKGNEAYTNPRALNIRIKIIIRAFSVDHLLRLALTKIMDVPPSCLGTK